MTATQSYDQIGVGYTAGRRPDPRWARAITGALHGAKTVINLGAGTGSYEPDEGRVIAVEPAWVMLSQRPATSAPAIRAIAEQVPLVQACAEATMAVLTVHHWSDWRAGLAEMRRLAPRRVVVTFDPAVHAEFWLVRDYIPEVARLIARAPLVDEVGAQLGADIEVTPLPVPWDCTDGFLPAHWRRPAAYLDPKVRACCSGLAQVDQEAVARGIGRLTQDLRSGAWKRRYAHLMDQEAIDAGFRIIVSQDSQLTVDYLAPLPNDAWSKYEDA